MEEPKSYQFGRAAQQSPAMLHAIDRLGDRLARRLRLLIEPLSGVRPVVTPRPVERQAFKMWDAVVPPFTSLSLYRLHPVKGIVVLRMDAPLISALVDRFYGGNGGSPDMLAREFTPTESRLIERLSAQAMAALVDGWSEVVPVTAALLGRETAVAQADGLPTDIDLIVQSFDVNIGGKDSWTVEFVYPAEGLTAIEAVNGSRGGEESRPSDPIWRNMLASRVEDVRLPARTVLARPNLKMSELVALKPGDVINIHIARHLPLLIGDRVFAHGTIGEQDGRAAFMIEKLA